MYRNVDFYQKGLTDYPGPGSNRNERHRLDHIRRGQSMSPRGRKSSESSNVSYDNRDAFFPLNVPRTRSPTPFDLASVYGDDEDDESEQPMIEGTEVIDVVLNRIVSHPFLVIRRQCQVHIDSNRFHRFPISLPPIIFCLLRYQDGTCLWKGLGSSVISVAVHAINRSLLSELTGWPKAGDLHHRSSKKRRLQNLGLEFLTAAITAPIYAVAVTESIQSCVASETYDLPRFFREAGSRIVVLTFAPVFSRSRWYLPIWVVSLTYGVFHTLHYSVTNFFYSQVYQYLRSRKHMAKRYPTDYYSLGGNAEGDSLHDVSKDSGAGHEENTINWLKIYESWKSRIIALMITEAVLYPFETVLIRIVTQGSRAIIDNLDDGVEVCAVASTYSGPIDCAKCIMSSPTEGGAGFFKGFGAFIWQCALHAALFSAFEYAINLIKPQQKGGPKKTYYD